MRFNADGKPIKEPVCYMVAGGGVLCSDWQKNTKVCDKCGWNPVVAQKRSEAVRDKLNMGREK